MRPTRELICGLSGEARTSSRKRRGRESREGESASRRQGRRGGREGETVGVGRQIAEMGERTQRREALGNERRDTGRGRDREGGERGRQCKAPCGRFMAYRNAYLAVHGRECVRRNACVAAWHTSVGPL